MNIKVVFFPFQGKKGRKFIDKKRDVLHTFKVVARSQRDPLAADETAPQGVLQSVNEVSIEVMMRVVIIVIFLCIEFPRQFLCLTIFIFAEHSEG